MDASTQAPDGSGRKTANGRAFRGLFLVFVLTFLNLAGLTLTAIGLNALGDWSIWQFIGLFGLVEAGSGLANLITPNLWAMPVVEQETSNRTRTVLAVQTLALLHWGGLARTAAGAVMIVAAAYQSGVHSSFVLLPAAIGLIAWLQVALSALLARAGVAWHDYDVVQMTFNWYRTFELPPISLSASALQFALSLITIPAITVLRPGVLYQPGMGIPSATVLLLALATLLTTVLALAAWYPRISLRAPAEQLQEAEARA